MVPDKDLKVIIQFLGGMALVLIALTHLSFREEVYFAELLFFGFLSAAWSSGLSSRIVIDTVLVQNLLVPFSCVFEKDTLQQFPLFGGLGKQFQISINLY